MEGVDLAHRNESAGANKMNKLSSDSNILSLQHKLEAARYNTREAENTGCSEDLIIELMDAEDAIISQLLKMGCHLRDC